MPYIKQGERDAFDPIIRQFSTLPGGIENSGELNYIFTMIAQAYIKQHDLSYKVINDILGAFTGAKLEFYRRIAAPYEDGKIVSNGDVYNERD